MATNRSRAPTRAQRLSPQLVLHLLGYRIELLLYWCGKRSLPAALTSALDVDFVIESACENVSKAIAVQLKGCRVLGGSLSPDNPEGGGRGHFVVALLKTAERMAADVDRILAHQPGWDWYCLGRAVGAYRVAIREDCRHDDRSDAAGYDGGSVARAALAIPLEEAKLVPSLKRARELCGSWRSEFFTATIETDQDLEGLVGPKPEEAIELWHQRLILEIQEAFPAIGGGVRARERLVGGYLDVYLDDLGMIAYREVCGERRRAALQHDPRLWLIFKELVRAAGTPRSLKQLNKLRAENGYAGKVDDHTHYSDKYKLNGMIAPLELEVIAVRKCGYVLDRRKEKTDPGGQ